MKDNVVYVDFTKPRYSNLKNKSPKPSLFIKVKNFMMRLLGKDPNKKAHNYDTNRLIK